MTAANLGLFLVMIAVILLLSQREQRRVVVQPIIMMLLSGFLLGLAQLFAGWEMHTTLRLVGEFCLYAAVGHAGFLLVIVALRRAFRWSPQKIYLDIVMAAIYVMIAFPVLSKAGLKTSDLVTSTALITGILALAMQGTLGNIFAGIAIHLHHPFDVGDWIQFNDKREHIGKVKEISWRATTVVTLDSVEVVVPNSKLAEMPLTNFKRPERWSRRSIYFVCPYSVPPAQVHAIVLDAIVGSRGVLTSPAPTIVTNTFTERGIEYWLRFFTEDMDTRDGVDGGVRDRIWYSLDRQGISMPPAVHKVEFTEVSVESKQAMAQNEIQRREGILRGLSLCQGLPESALEIMARESRISRYLPKEVIIRQNDSGSELFVIQAGSVSVSATEGSATTSVVLTRLGPGDFFGEMSLLMGDPRSATVTADSACELLVIDKKVMAAVFASAPDLVNTISNSVASRKENLITRLAETRENEPKGEEISVLVKIKKYFGIQ